MMYVQFHPLRQMCRAGHCCHMGGHVTCNQSETGKVTYRSMLGQKVSLVPAPDSAAHVSTYLSSSLLRPGVLARNPYPPLPLSACGSGHSPHGSLEGVGGLKTNEAYHSKADALLIPEM